MDIASTEGSTVANTIHTMGSLNLFDQNENDGYNLLFEECTTSTRATDDEQNWPQLETVLIDPYFFHSSTTSYLPIDHGPLYVDTIDGSDSLIHGSWGSYGETEEWDTFASGPSDLGAYCFDNTPESVSAPISDGLHKCPFQSCQRSFDRHCEAKKHERTHLSKQERPHLCDNCEEGFIYAKDLRRHKHSRHPAKFKRDLFHCPHLGCKFSSPRKDKLKSHEKARHNGDRQRPVRLQSMPESSLALIAPAPQSKQCESVTDRLTANVKSSANQISQPHLNIPCACDQLRPDSVRFRVL